MSLNRRILFFLLLPLVSLSLLLVIIESGLFVLEKVGVLRRTGFVSRLLRPSNIPNIEYELVPNSADAGIRINSLGFRSDEIPLKKVAGEFRILVLGDSVTFGTGGRNEGTYPSILQERLRRYIQKGVLGFG